MADGDRIVISCDSNGIEEERTWSLNEDGELVQVILIYRVDHHVIFHIYCFKPLVSISLVQRLWLKEKNIVAERIYKRT